MTDLIWQRCRPESEARYARLVSNYILWLILDGLNNKPYKIEMIIPTSKNDYKFYATWEGTFKVQNYTNFKFFIFP